MKEELEKDSLQYFVPPNVSARFEIIDGFGFKELFICIIVLAIGLCINYISGFIVNTQTINIEELSYEEKLNLDIEDGIEVVTIKNPVIPTPVRVIIFLALPTFLAFLIVRKNPITGICISDMIKARNEFNKKQKRYLYKYESGG
jgi:hypothetical protein